jgi:hypothetical protein
MNFYLSTPSKHIGLEELYLHTFLTLAINGDDWSAPHLRHFALGKEHCYIKHEAGWAPELIRMFWRGEKSVAPIGIQIPYLPSDSLLTILTTIYQPPR